MEAKKTQLETIKQIIDDTGQISRNYCLRNFITTRLGAYICDLNKMGYNLKGEYVKTEFGQDFVYKHAGQKTLF